MNDSFGPWSTAMTTGTNPQLNTFWKRRLAMLSSLKQSNSRVTGRTVLVLAVFAFAGLAFPTLQWVAQSGFADQAKALDRSATAELAREQGKAAARGMAAADAASKDEYFPRPTETEREILAALEKPVDIEFLELALEDCLTGLQEMGKIDLWIDKAKIAEEGTNLDQPITLKLKGRRLDSVLNLVLNPRQLTYLYEDEVLKITTTSAAADLLITRTYPVGDLCQDIEEVHIRVGGMGGGFFAVADLHERPIELSALQTGQAPMAKAGRWAMRGALLQAFGNGGAARQSDQKTEPKEVDADKEGPVKVSGKSRLMHAITSTVEPDSWEEQGGPGMIVSVGQPSSLVIRQTWGAHKKVLQLLRDLRAAKRLPQDAPKPAAAGARNKPADKGQE